jgi:hypothetical protein
MMPSQTLCLRWNSVCFYPGLAMFAGWMFSMQDVVQEDGLDN